MDTFIINEIKEEPVEVADNNTCEKFETKTEKIKLFKCEICDKLFSHNCFLNLHMKIHTNDKPFHCTLCPKKYITNSRLKVHLVSHTGLKPFKCDKCDKAFPRKGDLKKHEPVHCGIKPFKCNQCELAFRQMKCLKVHVVIMHSGEKPYKCDICGKAFVIRNYLDRHKLIHSDNGERPYKCDQCDKTYKDPCHLRRHKRTTCEKNIFKCNLCSKRFLLEHWLETHMNSQHKPEVPNNNRKKCKEIKSEIKIEPQMEMFQIVIKEEPDLVLMEEEIGS